MTAGRSADSLSPAEDSRMGLFNLSCPPTDYRHYFCVVGIKVGVYSRGNSGNSVRYIREDHLGGVSGPINSNGTWYVKKSCTFVNRCSSCTWSGAPTNPSILDKAAGFS